MNIYNALRAKSSVVSIIKLITVKKQCFICRNHLGQLGYTSGIWGKKRWQNHKEFGAKVQILYHLSRKSLGNMKWNLTLLLFSLANRGLQTSFAWLIITTAEVVSCDQHLHGVINKELCRFIQQLAFYTAVRRRQLRRDRCSFSLLQPFSSARKE